MLCTQTQARALTSGPSWVNGPTCWSDRSRGGTDRSALADGEVPRRNEGHQRAPHAKPRRIEVNREGRFTGARLAGGNGGAAALPRGVLAITGYGAVR